MDDATYRRQMVILDAQRKYRAGYERIKSQWPSYNEQQKLAAKKFLLDMNAMVDRAMQGG